MKKGIVAAAMIIGCTVSAGAQQAKIKGCFSRAEQAAEQQVRHGIFLREAAARCDAQPYSAGTLSMWTGVNRQFGERFARQTDVRRKAFDREFPHDDIGTWDGRLVMHFRYYPLSQGYCQDVRNQLRDVQAKGWGAFVKQSVKSRGEVLLDYKVCTGPTR